MKGIPVERLLLYFLIALLLPTVGVAVHYWSCLKKLMAVELEIGEICQRASLKQQKQWRNTRTRTYFEGADHFYIDKHLETLALLEIEREALVDLTRQEPTLPSGEISERLAFLEGKENQLAFKEGIVQRFAGVFETEEALKSPVEIDASDLVTILSRVEGIEMEGIVLPPDRPHLFVTDFRLERLDGEMQRFKLDMKLIKREFE